MSDLLARLAADPLATLRPLLLASPPDHAFQDDLNHRGPDVTAVEAAVLVPLIARREPSLLFTRRTDTLSRHSGQVSFPGGRRDPGDLSPVETALRETMEEIGVDPAFVGIAGFLPRYRIGSGFDILPVVGVVAEGFALAPDPREVAEIFEVPLAFFLDPANRSEEVRELGGRVRNIHVFRPGPHPIWGATAAIVHQLVGRLTGETAKQVISENR